MVERPYLPLGPDDPMIIFGKRVIGRCANCEGSGRLWEFDLSGGVCLSWQEPCEACNGIGFLLLEHSLDQDAPPF